MNDQARLSLRESLFRKTLKNIISEKDTKKLSQLILKHGIELLNMDSGGIFLLKKEEVGKLSYSAAMNIPVPFVGRMFSKKDSLISHIISTGRTVVLKDISAGSQLGKVWRGLGYKIVIGSPIIYQGKVLGVIQLASTDPKIKVDSFEKETLEIYAEYTSIAIHNAQLFGQLQEKTIDLEGTRDVLEEIGSYLDNIIKNIVDVLIVIDPDGKIRTVNKAVSDLLGYTKDELIGKSHAILYPEEELKQRVLPAFKKYSEKGFLKNFETFLLRKDGGKIPVALNATVVKDAKGKFKFGIGIFRDITELKRAEEHYRTLVQTIPDIIYKVDSNGIFTFISESIKQLGYTPEELIGKHFKKIIHPDDFEKVSRKKVLPKYTGKITGDADSPKLFDERRTGNRMTKNLEVRLLLKNQKEVSKNYHYAEVYSAGSWKAPNKIEDISMDYHYGEINSSGKWDKPVTEKNKNFIESIGFIKDITELKRVKEEIRKAKDYTDNIIKSMIDTLIVADPDGKIKTVNKATSDLLGYTEDELIGKPVGMIFAEEESIFKGTKLKKLIEEGSVRDYDIKYRTKKGDVVPVSLSGSVMRDKDGKLIGIVGIARDMRETKRLIQKEKELAVVAAIADAEKKRAGELERTHEASLNIMEDLDRRSKELEAAVNELRSTQENLIQAEKLSGLGELAAGVAHEIRNPLGNILISAELSLGSKEKLSESIKEYLNIILRNSDRANRIIKDLLDFAKPRDISFKMGNIAQVIKSACGLAKARCLSQNVHLTTKYSGKLPRILLDEQHLEEAFLNFILNALDAMPEGGEMTISACPDAENNEMVINFADTGHGISEKILGKVFDPFFTTRDEGTGLGLSLAYQVINYHKGKIEAKSKLGHGTEITVRLPIIGDSK